MRNAARIALTAAALAACRSEAAPPPAESAQLLRRVTMAESAGGLRKWELVATDAKLYEGEERIDAEKPVIRIEERGKDVSHIHSDRGRYHTATRDMEFEGHVVAESLKDRATLYTELLHYDHDHDRLWTDLPVRIDRADGTVKGVGLRSKSDLSEFTILHQTGTIK